MRQDYNRCEERRLYIWSNSFGRCIGGRHSIIGDAPRLNIAAMFTVVKTLYTSELQVQSLQIPTNCSYSAAKSSRLSPTEEEMDEFTLSRGTVNPNHSEDSQKLSWYSEDENKALVWSKEHHNEE